MFYIFIFTSKSITQADILIAKYLLITHNISSMGLCDTIIDDLFKASSRELPYIFRAIGVLLHQTQVNKSFADKCEMSKRSFKKAVIHGN